MNRLSLLLRNLLRHPAPVAFAIAAGTMLSGCTEDKWDFSQRQEPVRPITVVYVNVEEVNPLNATLYTMDDKPFFTHVIMSSALVTSDASQKATLSCSENVEKALALIPDFHNKGVKTILSVTGSGCGLGFANMNDDQIESFSSQIKTIVDKYDLDGIDFNDENAEYGMHGFTVANKTSYAALIKAVRGKIGTEKLVTVYDNSIGYSRFLTSVAPTVDYAWSATFGQVIDKRSRIGLANWQFCGFSQKLDVEFVSTDTYTVQQQLRQFQEGNMGALMFYNLRKTPETFSIPGQYDWMPPTVYTVTTEHVRQILDRTADRIFKSTVQGPEDSDLLDW